MRAVAIDSNGFFLSDLAGDPAYIGAPGTAPAPAGGSFAHYRPRWNGTAWEEGEPPAELEQRHQDAAANAARAWRNAELQRADVELAKVQDDNRKARGTVADWRAYRNALRDMTETHADPRQWVRPLAPDA